MSIKKLFVNETNCYYLSENNESSGICLRKINLNNYNNTLVYDSVDKNIEDYFGIIQEQKNMMKLLVDGVSDDDITYIKGKIMYVDAKGHKKLVECE